MLDVMLLMGMTDDDLCTDEQQCRMVSLTGIGARSMTQSIPKFRFIAVSFLLGM